METALAMVVGILIATGVYLMLARNLLRYLFGLILLSNAANLAIFTAGRLTRASPPLIPEGLQAPEVAVANPLPQALILTAIVIGFGLLAFALALIVRAYRQLGTLDADTMRVAEPETKPKRGRKRS
ncbi:cation:proton antiporter [Microbulbifer flavimaris]|uniref:Cation:proton antiporter n=1 Tax=Microbulbifer flavimaris TaxID=1781068 RepID=A0ABX4HZR5_9GAMM|nr:MULTISPECIES: Na+/H+ antiporter subunit C [Microbulbifer]KUJ83460.1 cation:proton antiporter [Microbulbifer sp. ZGT114]PCO05617.1 cation:proton antiporter [Microbulbifer flavimaris]